MSLFYQMCNAMAQCSNLAKKKVTCTCAYVTQKSYAQFKFLHAQNAHVSKFIKLHYKPGQNKWRWDLPPAQPSTHRWDHCHHCHFPNNIAQSSDQYMYTFVFFLWMRTLLITVHSCSEIHVPKLPIGVSVNVKYLLDNIIALYPSPPKVMGQISVTV